MNKLTLDSTETNASIVITFTCVNNGMPTGEKTFKFYKGDNFTLKLGNSNPMEVTKIDNLREFTQSVRGRKEAKINLTNNEIFEYDGKSNSLKLTSRTDGVISSILVPATDSNIAKLGQLLQIVNGYLEKGEKGDSPL